jgi:hypothetical protein
MRLKKRVEKDGEGESWRDESHVRRYDEFLGRVRGCWG